MLIFLLLISAKSGSMSSLADSQRIPMSGSHLKDSSISSSSINPFSPSSSCSSITPVIPLLPGSYTDIQTQTHRHTYTRLHQPIFVLLIRRGGRVGVYSMHALDLPNTSPWLWNSSCLRQLCSFILRGGNLQFGSRKFPHPVCLQSPGPLWWWRGVLVQTSQRRATLYTRHQTIRLTAGLTCACFITLCGIAISMYCCYNP